MRAVLSTVVCIFLVAASPGMAQGPLGNPAETTVDGEVAEVFGPRFVIAGDRGRILVDPQGLDRALPVKPGERVSAIGSLTDRTLLAFRIVRPDGAVLFPAASDKMRAEPDGRASVEAVLAALQLTPAGPPVRKKRHTEVMARMADGRTVYVSLDRLGRVTEIEDAVHDKAAVRAQRVLSQNDYRAIAERAGFQPLDDFEAKKHHVELLTRNRANELVELHIDRAGYIYKQVWIR